MSQASTDLASLATSIIRQDSGSQPETQRIARVYALNRDFLLWREQMHMLHRRDASIDDLREAIARVAGEDATPQIQGFRKYFEVSSDREFPPRLERAWVVVTGGEHLRVHYEQNVFGLHYRPRVVQRREILAGLEG